MVQESCEECILLPGCQNGYCSITNRCTCKDGWGGEFCNIKLDPCQIENICKNGGICKSEKDGAINCECQNGYYGKYCQKKKRTCNEHICLNNGSCYIHSDGTPKCKCVNNFIGTYCQTKIIKKNKMNVEIKSNHHQNINFANINMILFIIALIMLLLIMILLVSILIFKRRSKIIPIEDGDYKKENINISKTENIYTSEPYNLKFKENIDFSTTTPQLEAVAKEMLSKNTSLTYLKPFNSIYYTISYE